MDLSCFIFHTALYAMPYTHQPMLPNRMVRIKYFLLLDLTNLLQHSYHIIQGRIYKTNETCPRFTNIIMQDNGCRQFALVDSVLDQLPHVCEVGVFDGKSLNYFYMFFSRNRNIHLNRGVKALSRDLSWTGDILIVVLRRGGICKQNQI